ncbi:MAG: transketolase [Patescibacteria group bacterium]
MKNLRELVITTCFKSREGHIPSALSILDILWVLYNKVAKNFPDNPVNPDRDIIIVSKGHASLGLYAILSDRGFFPVELLSEFGKYNSILGGHPDCNKVPGVEASTGSLGHGLPIAVGFALGYKIKKTDNRVFAIIGDGESNEGSIWEAILLAAHHKLDNLCCIVDNNHSTDRALPMGDMVKKFESFGWDAVAIDGHNHNEILNALLKRTSGKPLAVIANTIKGYGCKIIENDPAWHHKIPSDAEYEILINNLY